MYTPSHFAITDAAELQRIVRENPLGILVTGTGTSLDANHIPFEFDPEVGALGRLTAHVARSNPLWQQCAGGAEVLVVFRGAHGYISPNWYPSKHETHRLVPTWNYEAVHVHGRLSVQDDEKFVRGVVGRLTRTHEARAARSDAAAPGRPKPDAAISGLGPSGESHEVNGRGGHVYGPWKMSDSEPSFIAGMLQAVVGIAIDVVRMEGKAKLSQNREPRDVQGAIDALRQRGQEELASAMERRFKSA